MTKLDLRLSGTKQIRDYCECHWDVILDWIDNDGFPSAKLGGHWIAYKDMIDDWFRSQIIAKNTTPKKHVNTPK